MRFYWFALGLLGVWRITHLLSLEDGPWTALSRARERLQRSWGNLIACFYCLSVWIALPFACFLADGWRERLLLWPALSGGAILLEKWTDRIAQVPAAEYTEDSDLRDQEESGNVLRKQKNENAA